MTWTETERAGLVDMERAHLALDIRDLAETKARSEG